MQIKTVDMVVVIFFSLIPCHRSETVETDKSLSLNFWELNEVCSYVCNRLHSNRFGIKNAKQNNFFRLGFVQSPIPLGFGAQYLWVLLNSSPPPPPRICFSAIFLTLLDVHLSKMHIQDDWNLKNIRKPIPG